MDTENDQTLFEISEKKDTLEKPKKKSTPRQLEALAKARQVRADNKQKEIDEEEKHRKSFPTYIKDDLEPMIPKEKKASVTQKKKVKPTIIQFQESDSESDDGLPTIIIKNKRRTPQLPVPEPPPPPPVATPAPVQEPIPQKPKQYIRRAY